MRRHLTAAALAGLAALSAPGSARAQAQGEVTTGPGEDMFLNAAECDQAQGLTLDLRWWVNVPGGALTSGLYKVYATNTAPLATGSGPKLCQTVDDTTATPAVYARRIGGDIIASPTDNSRTESFDSWAFPLAANKACNVTEDQTIYVCVHFFPYTSGTTPAAEPTGSATGTLVLSTSKPAAPTNVTLRIGDTRLYASWSKGSGGATAQEFLTVATPSAEVGLPDGSRPGERYKTQTDTSATVENLVNGTEYTVVVYAVSASGTQGDGSAPVTGTPQPVSDFWDVYEGSAGTEKGGCGGPAGPLALMGLLAALWVKARAGAAGARRKP